MTFALRKGMQEGMQQGMQQVARKLSKRNFSNDDIAEDTGLTIEQIEKLRHEQ